MSSHLELNVLRKPSNPSPIGLDCIICGRDCVDILEETYEPPKSATAPSCTQPLTILRDPPGVTKGNVRCRVAMAKEDRGCARQRAGPRKDHVGTFRMPTNLCVNGSFATFLLSMPSPSLFSRHSKHTTVTDTLSSDNVCSSPPQGKVSPRIHRRSNSALASRF
jgi:hypothetical protein